MNVRITTFISPFSFFCVNENNIDFDKINLISQQIELDKQSKCNLEDVYHGQYVAVMWRNKWARGIVCLESKCLIWLIDYGIFVTPEQNIQYFKGLSFLHRKLSTNIFEASIHGVVPVDKVLSYDCNIKNKITSVWTQSSIQKSQDIIENASRTYFQPIALLSSPHNDVVRNMLHCLNWKVLGNLYVEIKGKGYVNIIDELETWPVFFEKNNEAYIKNLPMSYISRRRHRSCLLKPDIPGFSLPNIDMKINLKDYLSIVAKSPTIDTLLNKIETLSEAGSTVLEFVPTTNRSSLKISPSDIEKYSNRYVTFNGREYNMLTVLVNKARDLKICERYKDHDLKSIGRGYSYRTSKNKL